MNERIYLLLEGKKILRAYYNIVQATNAVHCLNKDNKTKRFKIQPVSIIPDRCVWPLD
jgi:hypothetical protein